MKVFVSYRHLDGEWVWNRLVPCLKAGGAEVLIDRDRFRPGGGVYRQMDETQDKADKHVLVLSRDYLASDACRHEMERAVAQDPNFERHVVLPVRRDDSAMPAPIKAADPLYVDLRDDGRDKPWDDLLRECGTTLGVAAPDWLRARDEVVRWLKDNTSVNLVVLGDAVRWRALIEDVKSRDGCEVGLVDLYRGATLARSRLIREMLASCDIHFPVREHPDDLGDFEDALKTRPLTRLGLLHFDWVAEAQRSLSYSANLFSALRYQVMDARNLVLLLQSRQPFGTLCPAGHPLSTLDLKTVELKARP